MIRPLQEEVRSHLRSGVAITNLTQCVEELVLNSLDAGASNITVRIDVPNFKVQVSDNGNGIAFGDLRLVGERYSSSKCHVLKDLEQLNFYGFRGEALASVREICDVLEIVTRHRASYQTFCKVFRNSQVLELAESRFPRTSSGTTVTIHNIFTNLPVRRKSINETLDFERVRHRIASIALIHPNTAFLLINDSTGAKCLQTHVCKSSVSTFSQLFGNQRSKGLQQAQFEHKNFKVSGFISTDTHHSKSLQFLFVNGRLLLKTRIHKLVNSVLGKSELLKKCAASEIDSTSTQGYPSKTTSPQNIKTIDKHGIFVLNIDCLVTEYDICLEPAKTLIEFQDWDSVLYCVQRCVEEFLFKYDLISCSEQSPKSTETRADEGNSVFVEKFCHTNLEAFEYKREIETSNVKKSLHSSIVFRPKKAEEGDAVSQNKVPSLERGLSSPSNSLLSHQKHDSNDGDDTVSFTVSSCSNSKSLPRAVSLPSVEKLAPCLDLTSNVGKLPLSCTNKIGDEPLDGNDGNQINYTTTCHKSNMADSSIVTVSSSVKAAVPTLPVSRHCVCSDLQKTSACQCEGNGLSNIQRSLFNKLSKNCRINTVALSASPESRKACDSAVSLDKEGDLRTHHHLSDREQIPCPANTGSFRQSSVAKPRSTETSSVTVNTSRSKAMPTFTSPCPITLQRVCTRKRLQSNKETASSGPGLAPKNRRIITLQGSCNRRARYDRDSAGHSSSRKDSECKARNTHVVCCDQIVQKLADNSCNPKLSTSSDSGIVPGTHVHNYPDNLCVTTMTNTGMNSCDSNSGLPALFRDTCDAAVAFDCNQPDTSYPIKQAGSSSLHNKQTQPVERNIVNIAEVPYLNGTEQEGVLHKCTESWHQPQKESTVAEKGVSADQSSESSLEPSSGADEKRKSSLSNDWYCTFDALLGRNLFINTRTGHSSFEPPNELNVDNDHCAEASVIEASEVENDPPQQVPHPVAPHLSFSCTPWLPRQDRRQQASLCDDGNSPLFSKDVSRLFILYQEHQDSQEAEEKLCKWTDADTLKTYEQNLFNTADKSVAEMLDSWQNPVFTAPDKDILTANESGGCVKNQISVHNVVHPYRFTRDMLTDMRVLRQLDDKFIVGVVSQEGDDDGLLVLIDQHAAHERIRLEQLQSELFEDSDSSPPLHDKPRIKSSAVSPPLEFTLFAEEVQLLTRFQSEIERIGMCFAISESLQLSEETSIFVHRVPSVLVEREVSEVKRGRPSVAVSKLKELVREHLEHVSTTCGVPAVIPKVIFQVISSQACHGAVKFGEPLGVSECQELIKHLSKCQLPFQCAHGRPSVIPLADLRFLAKKMTSQEIVCRPRMARLQSALVKDH